MAGNAFPSSSEQIPVAPAPVQALEHVLLLPEQCPALAGMKRERWEWTAWTAMLALVLRGER